MLTAPAFSILVAFRVKRAAIRHYYPLWAQNDKSLIRRNPQPVGLSTELLTYPETSPWGSAWNHYRPGRPRRTRGFAYSFALCVRSRPAMETSRTRDGTVTEAGDSLALSHGAYAGVWRDGRPGRWGAAETGGLDAISWHLVAAGRRWRTPGTRDGTAGSWDARFLSAKGGHSSAPMLAGGHVQ